MTEKGDGIPNVPEAQVGKKRGISLVWTAPLVALAIGGSLAYRAYMAEGPLITVTFDNASGIQAGQTTVRYRDVVIGTVKSVDVAEDLGHVDIGIQLDAKAGQAATQGSKFWIVKPRIGAGGISGLSTIVSGSFIAVFPGKKDAPREKTFVGLTEPPADVLSPNSATFVLEANSSRGVSAASQVLHRGVEVGHVESVKLAPDGRGTVISFHVKSEFKHLVQDTTRFWNASGVDISAGLNGVNVQTESLVALLVGGIAFETPQGHGGAPSKSGEHFRLYDTREEALFEDQYVGARRIIVRSRRLGSLRKGDPVLYREVEVGRVGDGELTADARFVDVTLEIQRKYRDLVRENSQFWNASGIRAKLGITGVSISSESLSSLLKGGVAFATPEKPGPEVADGTVFELHDEAHDDWSKWDPSLETAAAPGAKPNATPAAGAAQAPAKSAPDVRPEERGAEPAKPQEGREHEVHPPGFHNEFR